jgi:hypothetical protein
MFHLGLISKQSGLILKQKFENVLPRIAKLYRAMPRLPMMPSYAKTYYAYLGKWLLY